MASDTDGESTQYVESAISDIAQGESLRDLEHDADELVDIDEEDEEEKRNLIPLVWIVPESTWSFLNVYSALKAQGSSLKLLAIAFKKKSKHFPSLSFFALYLSPSLSLSSLLVFI